MLARSDGSADKMLYWYNQSLDNGGIIPADAVYGYATDSLPDVAANSARHKTVHPNSFNI